MEGLRYINNNKNRLTDILFAILIYLPSCIIILPSFYLFFCFFAFLLYLKSPQKLDHNYYIILFISTVSYINQVAHININLTNSGSINSILPYSLLIIFIYLSIFNIDESTFYIILYIILLEILIGIIEYYLEIPYLIKTNATHITEMDLGDSDLFYYNRVTGLSNNSSTFAVKIFLGFLLLFYKKDIRKHLFYIFFVFLIIGLIITFNRSAIISTVIFFILYSSTKLIVNYSRQLINYKAQKLSIAVIFVFISFIMFRFDFIWSQFNRGQKTIDYSGRDMIFTQFINFTEDNIFFGNGSYKLWFNIGGVLYHAHNSFLETLATNGIFIFSIYMFLIFRNINKYNYYFIIPIMCFSLTQYGILWGISFMDIIFFYFLFKVKKP